MFSFFFNWVPIKKILQVLINLFVENDAKTINTHLNTTQHISNTYDFKESQNHRYHSLSFSWFQFCIERVSPPARLFGLKPREETFLSCIISRGKTLHWAVMILWNETNLEDGNIWKVESIIMRNKGNNMYYHGFWQRHIRCFSFCHICGSLELTISEPLKSLFSGEGNGGVERSQRLGDLHMEWRTCHHLFRCMQL